MRLHGKNILITGASQGLGKTIAKACLAEGASVFLCARGAGLLEETRAELASFAAPGQRVLARAADVSRAEDVRALMDTVWGGFTTLDGLVNNAGIYGPKGLIEDVDFDEWVEAIEINLLACVRLCREVVPHLRKRGRGKIVNLSGGGATNPLPRISAYAASKAAVVRFTETLAVELRGTEITVNAIAPGALNTRLLDEVLAAGPAQVGEGFYNNAVRQKEGGGADLEIGGRLCVFLLSPDSDGITGRLISAVWDPWEKLPDHLAEIQAGDVYTLRRIVPKDRGMNWGDH